MAWAEYAHTTSARTRYVFGPMNSSSRATEARRATEMFHAFMTTPLDAEQIARVAEDPPDVGGAVREVVSRIFVRLARVPDGVSKTAAVGVDQPAKEQLRIAFECTLLPIHEFDDALVLPAGTVLGKRHGRCLE
jgi:hypothetical protein